MLFPRFTRPMSIVGKYNALSDVFIANSAPAETLKRVRDTRTCGHLIAAAERQAPAPNRPYSVSDH
jgi:hypothetical protein